MTNRILIADDTTTVLDYLELVFGKHGFDTIRALGGKAAIQLAIHEQPDLVLADIMMPDVDGYEVCRQLRSTAETAQTPILLYSAIVGEEVRARAMAAGADEYLGKSIHHSELVGRVRDWLASRSLPGGIGEPRLREVGMDLLRLLQVELVWLLRLHQDGLHTTAVVSERGEQQARRFRQALQRDSFQLAELDMLEQAFEAGNRFRRSQVSSLGRSHAAKAMQSAFRAIDVHEMQLAPIGYSSSWTGCLVTSTPNSLTRQRDDTELEAIALRYASACMSLPVAASPQPSS